MITTNVFQRVFHVRFKGSTATAFTVEHDCKQYLVSAKHVFDGISTSDTIEIYHQSQWKQLRVELTGVGSEEVDIIVLSAQIQLSPTFSLPATSKGLSYGQDAFFLGFPFGLFIEADAINRELPLPLVKRCGISGSIKVKGSTLWLLDGFNNPGFSGGPVVYRPIGGDFRSEMKLLAVISGYRFSAEPIYSGDTQLPVNARANTGIIHAFDIGIVFDLIKVNPNGAPIIDAEQGGANQPAAAPESKPEANQNLKPESEGCPE